MTRILATAEAFGFGPASKLHAVSVELARRGVRIDFVGSGSALTFAQANAGTFASIRGISAPSELADISPDGYDGALSVMDPHLTVWAKANGVPSAYVDSLYWFWQWEAGHEAEMRRRADELAAAPSVSQAFAELEAIPIFDSQYIAHYLSAVSCVQRAPKIDARSVAIQGLEHTQVVDAVIDLSHRRTAKPEYWLASASGMINPLLPLDSAVDWARSVIRLLTEAAELSGVDAPIILTGNAEVLARAADAAGKAIEVKPMSHGAILEALGGALACLTPPGLTTMLECAAYGVPLLTLPEQHFGHVSNYREVAACGDAASFPHALIDPTGATPGLEEVLSETVYVSDQLKQHASERTEVWSRMVRGLADGMRSAHDDREKLRAAQEAAMRAFVGGFDGSVHVADLIDAMLHHVAN